MTIVPYTDEILSSIKLYHNRPESNMKKIRKSRGLTQKALADQTGISVMMISHLELGTRYLSEENRLIIAHHLDCDPSDL